MANVALKIGENEVTMNPKDKAIFLVSPKLALRRLAENLALVLKAKAEDSGVPISKEEMETRKKESPAFRLVSAKTWTEVSANCQDILDKLEEIKNIKAQADKINAAYAPKSFEAYETEAQNMVESNKDAILTELAASIKE